MLRRTMCHIYQIPYCLWKKSALGVLLMLVCILTWPKVILAQLDICGCIGNPNNLGAFDASDETTYPPGTTRSFDTITIPLPDNGILIFNSFTVSLSPRGFSATVRFQGNNANDPVTLLVTGDVTINGVISVDGGNGTFGSSSINGIGASGGPGGFRGGDGAYELINFANDGGAGFGAGGGAAGTALPLENGGVGTFLGVPELLPLVGGSGGGGGASTSNASSCSGGGGGGGGGAILIAANGTITVNGTISADGGSFGNPGKFSCASSGGPASGGAIRLVANIIAGSSTLRARGNRGVFGGEPGAIRLEAFTNTLLATAANPVATRAPAPGPLVNPLTPTVVITAVNGTPVMDPLGAFGEVDIILSAPGVATIDLTTTAVPSGTTVEVTAKPRVGGAPTVVSTTLTDCDTAGDCTAAVAFNLLGGRYIIEARATFETQ